MTTEEETTETAAKKEPTGINPLKYKAEDGGIMDAWIELYGTDWLYVTGFEQWYLWKETHWIEDKTRAASRSVLKLLNDMNEKVRDLLKAEDDKEKIAMLKAYRSATRRSKARVGSIEGMAAISAALEPDSLDNTDSLNLTNGTLNLETWELCEHQRKDLITHCLPYAYHPAAEADNWLRFLDSFDRNAVYFLQEFAGYALTTDTQHEIALWLYGPPGGGKSTFLAGMEAMLGSKAGILGLADIERNRFALAELPGKTLIVSAEQPSDFVKSTDTINRIISGEPVLVDRKFKSAVAVTPKAKIAWAMNDFPRVSNANNGIFRRVKVVHFPPVEVMKRDTKLRESFRCEQAGILNWAIEGLKRLQERGRFHIPVIVETATREFVEQNDIPANFVDECCYTGVDFKASGSQLYQAYKTWAMETGHRPQSSTSIAGDWRRLGFEKYLSSGYSFWRGVGLKAEHNRSPNGKT